MVSIVIASWTMGTQSGSLRRVVPHTAGYTRCTRRGNGYTCVVIILAWRTRHAHCSTCATGRRCIFAAPAFGAGCPTDGIFVSVAGCAVDAPLNCRDLAYVSVSPRGEVHVRTCSCGVQSRVLAGSTGATRCRRVAVVVVGTCRARRTRCAPCCCVLALDAIVTASLALICLSFAWNTVRTSCSPCGCSYGAG